MIADGHVHNDNVHPPLPVWDPMWTAAGSVVAASGGRRPVPEMANAQRLALLSQLDYDDPESAPQINDIYLTAMTTLGAVRPMGRLH